MISASEDVATPSTNFTNVEYSAIKDSELSSLLQTDSPRELMGKLHQSFIEQQQLKKELIKEKHQNKILNDRLDNLKNNAESMAATCGALLQPPLRYKYHKHIFK